MSYAISFKAITQPNGVAAKALKNLFQQANGVKSHDPSTVYMDRWLQDTIQQQNNDDEEEEEEEEDDDVSADKNETSIRRSARILNKIVDGSLNQSRDTTMVNDDDEEEEDEDYEPSTSDDGNADDAEFEENVDDMDLIENSLENSQNLSSSSSTSLSPDSKQNTSGVEYVRAHRGKETPPPFDVDGWQRKHELRERIIQQVFSILFKHTHIYTMCALNVTR
jgi:hypothetical protein